MNPDDYQSAIYDSIQKCRRLDEVLPLLRDVCNHLGFEHFAFSVRAPVINRTPAFFLLSSLSEDFVRSYEEHRWIIDDPVIKRASFSLKPFYWDELDWSTSSGSRELSRELAQSGMTDGFSIPLRGPVLQSGILSLSRKSRAANNNRRAILEDARTFGLNLLDQVIEFPELQQMRNDIAKLTDREAEFLRLSALGHPLKKIHTLMQIKQSTATYFTNRIISKFGVRRLRSAVNQAQLNGIIDLVGFPNRIVGTKAWISEAHGNFGEVPSVAPEFVYVPTPWVHRSQPGPENEAGGK